MMLMTHCAMKRTGRRIRPPNMSLEFRLSDALVRVVVGSRGGGCSGAPKPQIRTSHLPIVSHSNFTIAALAGMARMAGTTNLIMEFNGESRNTTARGMRKSSFRLTRKWQFVANVGTVTASTFPWTFHDFLEGRQHGVVLIRWWVVNPC
jgi:hypothetical protein